MAKARRTGTQNERPLMIEAQTGETKPESMARVMVEPYLRHGAVTSALSDKMIGKLPGEPRFDDFGRALKTKAQQVGSAEIALASEMLAVQAQTLDAIFTEYARRATVNIGEYINASERYMRLALKAQAGSRATLDALVRLHQPREQTVKHVHVNEGGQAVVADHFHQHRGGGKNGKSNEQSHATGAIGEGTALPRPDPKGEGVSVTRRRRKAALQNARRDQPGSP